jgi:hypothetical protein
LTHPTVESLGKRLRGKDKVPRKTKSTDPGLSSFISEYPYLGLKHARELYKSIKDDE